MKIEGVWLPVITPFYDGQIDFPSYQKLIDHYISKGISGIIPLGTTGESPVMEEDEFFQIIEKTVEYVNYRVPIYVGLSGNDTKQVIQRLKHVNRYQISGILSATPYYNLPSQEGIYEHFSAISHSTDMNIILYNIPYRTGRNIDNETTLKLAELPNVIGIKDSCGNIKQSMELLFNCPDNFSILTGEDWQFYTHLVLGGSGGILASAHVETEKFLGVYRLVKQNNHLEALLLWKELSPLISLLFKEPNPAPIKYLLNQMGCIQSSEMRLPLTEVSSSLKGELDSLSFKS